MGDIGEALGSLGVYLRYLREAGVEGIPRSPAAGTEPPPTPDVRAQAEAEASPEERLLAVQRELGECTRCPLSRTRRNIVFGEGSARAEVVLVGEGPGGEEDRSGRPFVGPAGQLLTRILRNAMGMARSEVYICNIVKCRPPENRTPREEEVAACFPFLEKQIEAIRPRVILTLGRPAAHALLGVDSPMHRLRGRWQSYKGIPVMPTFHPSYVLRTYTVPVRRSVFEDTQEVLRRLGRSSPQKKGAGTGSPED